MTRRIGKNMDGHHRMRRKTKIHVPNRYLPEASTSEETSLSGRQAEPSC